VGEKWSSDLQELARARNESAKRVDVVIQTADTQNTALLQLLSESGAKIKSVQNQLGSIVIEAPVSVVEQLANNSSTSFLSLDREVRSQGQLSLTTGADAVRSLISSGDTRTLDGSGIGIAILDSGIQASHDSFAGTKGSRVVVSKNFTDDTG